MRRVDVDAALATVRPQVKRIALRYEPSDTDERDDLTQIGLIAAWHAFTEFDPSGGDVVGWMRQKAKWAILAHLRDRPGPWSRWEKHRTPRVVVTWDLVLEHSLTLGDDTPDGSPGPERVVEARDELARVRSAVTAMPYRDAEALLADRDRRVAIMVRDGVGESTVSLRRAKALRVLREAA